MDLAGLHLVPIHNFNTFNIQIESKLFLLTKLLLLFIYVFILYIYYLFITLFLFLHVVVLYARDCLYTCTQHGDEYECIHVVGNEMETTSDMYM